MSSRSCWRNTASFSSARILCKRGFLMTSLIFWVYSMPLGWCWTLTVFRRCSKRIKIRETHLHFSSWRTLASRVDAENTLPCSSRSRSWMMTRHNSELLWYSLLQSECCINYENWGMSQWWRPTEWRMLFLTFSFTKISPWEKLRPGSIFGGSFCFGSGTDPSASSMLITGTVSSENQNT